MPRLQLLQEWPTPRPDSPDKRTWDDMITVLQRVLANIIMRINEELVDKLGDRMFGLLDLSPAELRLPVINGDFSGANTGELWYSTPINRLRLQTNAGPDTIPTFSDAVLKNYDSTISAKLNFSPTGILVVPVYSGDPTFLQDGMIWYNSTLGAFRVRQNGVTKTITTS